MPCMWRMDELWVIGWLEGAGPWFSRHDGLIDAVGGVVRQFDQQQQLREGFILEFQTFRQPLLGDAQDLR